MSANKTQEIIKKIIYSFVWTIGYSRIYLELFGKYQDSILIIVLTYPVPILFGLQRIWKNYLNINKIKKYGTYLRNSYNTPGKPKTVFWFQIYCQVTILINFLLFLYLFFFAYEAKGYAFSAMCGLAFCVTPLFLPRKEWVWIYNLTFLALGLPSFIFIPVLVPLIYFWLKPEVRKYYKS